MSDLQMIVLALILAEDVLKDQSIAEAKRNHLNKSTKYMNFARRYRKIIESIVTD